MCTSCYISYRKLNYDVVCSSVLKTKYEQYQTVYRAKKMLAPGPMKFGWTTWELCVEKVAINGGQNIELVLDCLILFKYTFYRNSYYQKIHLTFDCKYHHMSLIFY